MARRLKKLACHIDGEFAAVDRIFGPPALLPGENPNGYAELLSRVREAVKPCGIIEEILVRDVVDHCWDILRWRRIKAELHAKLEGWQDDRFPNAEFRQVSSNIERIEHLIAIAEHRRNAGWREVAQYRTTFAECLRTTIEQVITDNGKNHLRELGPRSTNSLSLKQTHP